MSNIPVLVKNDAWLTPNAESIQTRIDRHDAEMDRILTKTGSIKSYASAHDFLGINYDPQADQWNIREWAPNAKSVSLIGDFNLWDKSSHPLEPSNSGIWSLTLPGNALQHLQKAKLHVVGADDTQRDRIPACIRKVVQDTLSNDYSAEIWNPSEHYYWRNDFDASHIKSPLIYEAHVGMAGEDERIHTYREFATEILPRISKAGYNVIQLMAVQEHPYYGSFGYHVSSFFAPCSRFGTPDDLKFLIDTAHGMGIAVLLDIVHSHAVKNIAEGLNRFDGTDYQYFHDGGKGEHPQWDSKCFDYGKEEVRQFLLSNVRYWLEEFRFDGFRFDGITSMLYDHHGNISFDHYDKYFQDGVDNDAVLYLQLATTLAKAINPQVLLIAEDMSGMPGLCRPVSEGGIGFTHRLAMGIPDYWIKLLKEVSDENWDLERLWETMLNRRHGEATIAYCESHDQALVGDKTLAFQLMDKEMYWHMTTNDRDLTIERGTALHKMIRLFTLAFGGDAWLNFMGNEFGHPEWVDFPREGNQWSYQYCRRQWSLVDNPALRYQHLANFDRSMIDLAKVYPFLNEPYPELLYVHNDDKILCARRCGIVFIFNFHVDKSYEGYELPVPEMDDYRIVLNSDTYPHGGHKRVEPRTVFSAVESEGRPKIKIYLPSRTCMVLAKTT
ncbi:alpha-amylase family glycosyl hydrolase [Persicirhabdus sediminis]|uniref:1,4-alpha-glucan branching enzyme n=1 Tax=Persicirhabdus sediminis TaxID=454144 RepID=A0A8J7SML0_9BACT|nr:alpha-amylase family glycosyl hydrolase [Persicirhabdus sediminis]MBK1791163.1 alpha amylase C-terminal domain-containing protein [Persicirhabdus sediminis]